MPSPFAASSCAAIRILALLTALMLLALVLIVPARAETPVKIDISPTAACALTDTGEIVCWGFDIPLVRDVPEGEFTDLSLGPTDACAITVDSTVVCWGAGYAYVRNSVERILARDSEADLSASGLAQLLPAQRDDLIQVVVHPWRHYACARSGEGDIVCWGNLPPSRGSAPTGTGFTDLISTGRGFCALDADGRTTCWGDLVIDQFVSDAGPFVRIASSGNGLCGVSEEGEVRCLIPGSPPAPGPPQPYNQIFRNVHVIGAQGCAVSDDGSLHCRQTHHWCSFFFHPDVEYCPPNLIRFQSWDIPFTTLYEGGPDRETTAARSYVQLFGDQAACAITTEGEIDCWSDFRRGDPRHNVPERFRPQATSVDPETTVDSESPADPPSPADSEPPAGEDE